MNRSEVEYLHIFVRCVLCFTVDCASCSLGRMSYDGPTLNPASVSLQLGLFYLQFRFAAWISFVVFVGWFVRFLQVATGGTCDGWWKGLQHLLIHFMSVWIESR
jgi:hypothetical protein